MEEAERLVAERGKSQLTRPRDSFVTNRPSQAVTRWEMRDGGDGDGRNNSAIVGFGIRWLFRLSPISVTDLRPRSPARPGCREVLPIMTTALCLVSVEK